MGRSNTSETLTSAVVTASSKQARLVTYPQANLRFLGAANLTLKLDTTQAGKGCQWAVAVYYFDYFVLLYFFKFHTRLVNEGITNLIATAIE